MTDESRVKMVVELRQIAEALYQGVQDEPTRKSLEGDYVEVMVDFNEKLAHRLDELRSGIAEVLTDIHKPAAIAQFTDDCAEVVRKQASFVAEQVLLRLHRPPVRQLVIDASTDSLRLLHQAWNTIGDRARERGRLEKLS
jgi:hypothetical protein